MFFYFLFQLSIVIFLAIIAYLVGAIPTGYLFCQHFFRIDITKYGSGNIGATNVARVLGRRRFFFLIFFLDFFKTIFTLFLSSLVLNKLSIFDIRFLFLISIFLLIGNSYSIFLEFRGGKCVSTSLGILFFLFPHLFAGFLFVWFVFFISFRRVDIASLVAIVSILFQYLFFTHVNHLTLLFLFFMVSFVLFRHKKNLKKLFKKL